VISTDYGSIDDGTGDITFVKYDHDGKKYVNTPTIVDAEEAVGHLVDDYLNNKLRDSTPQKGKEIENTKANEDKVGENLILGAYIQVLFRRPQLTDDEKLNRLHEMFGDDPAIVRLGVKYLGEDIARSIWGDKIDHYTQNDTSSEDPVSIPSNVIQKSSITQGTGPISNQQDINSKLPDTLEQSSNSSTQGDSKTGGDPMILFAGQFYHQVTDLETKGRGLHFVLIRTYFNQTVYKGPFGYNWDHSYNLWLREEQEILHDGTLQNIVYRSTGKLREDKFIQSTQESIGNLPTLGDFQDAVFIAPEGHFDRLEKSSGKYILEMINGVRFEYNDDLYIERIIDLNQNEMLFEYTDKLLTKIRDPVGKEFVIDYDTMNRITNIFDSAGKRNIGYTYGNNGDLEEVDLFLEPDLIAGTDYRYSGPDLPYELQHNLIEIISPMGQSVLYNEYGSFPGTLDYNHVTFQRSADGEYQYEYGIVSVNEVSDPSIDPINVPRVSTIISYPNHHCIEHWFNNQGNIVQRTEQIFSAISGSTNDLVSKYRYNELGLLIEEIRPDGSGVEYRYQSEVYADLHGGDISGASSEERLTFGNLLRRIEMPRVGLGESRRIVSEYEYEIPGNRLTLRRGPFYSDDIGNTLPNQQIQEVNYDYDTRGNLIKIHYPDTLLADGSNQSLASNIFIYNPHGLITDVFIGSIHTQYFYFSDILRSGFVMKKLEDVSGIKQQTLYQIDVLGRITQIIDHFGAVTDTEWTKFDTPRTVILPEIISNAARPTISYQYDRNRQLVQSSEELILHNGTKYSDSPKIQIIHYDPYGRIIESQTGSSAQPDIRIEHIVLTPFGLKEKIIDPMGNTTFIEYNENMMISSVTRGYGTVDQTTQQIRYNISGEIVEMENGLGFKNVIERDGFGRASVTHDPDGNELEMEYDATGHIVSYRLHGINPETNTKVRWLEYENNYDSMGRLIERVDHLFIPGNINPDSMLRVQYFYDQFNRINTVIDSIGNKWFYTYDNLDRLIFLGDSEGNETQWKYDDQSLTLDMITKEVGTNDLGNKIRQIFSRTIIFNKRGLPEEETDNLGHKQRRGFDSRGLLTYFVDQYNHEFFTEFDIFGQPIAYRTNLDGHNVQAEIAYNSNGLPISIITPTKGLQIQNYDSINRLSKIQRDIFGGSGSGMDFTITFSFDKEGHIISRKDENGTEISRIYTPGGLLQKEFADISNFSSPLGDPSYKPIKTLQHEFKYTPTGKLALGKNNVSNVILRYDSLDRLIEEKNNGHSIQNGYDHAGRRTSLKFPDGRDITYTYSVQGMIKSIQQNDMGFNYPGNVNLTSSRILTTIQRIGTRPITMKFGSSHFVKISYDAGKQTIGIDWNNISNNSSIFLEKNLYGSCSELRIHQTGQSIRINKYDEFIRLITASDYLINSDLIDITKFKPASSELELLSTNNQQSAIDASITSVESLMVNKIPVNNFGYKLDDNTNRIKTETFNSIGNTTDSTIYIPDENDRYLSIGNNSIVYDFAGNMLNDGNHHYRYDTNNKLAEIRTSSNTQARFYDALYRLSRIESPSEIIEFIYDGFQLIEWRKNGVIESQVIPLERPHQYAHLASNGNEFTPLFNSMDSIIGWIDINGNITDKSTYDPFGQVLKRTLTWPAPLGFSGYWYDSLSETYELLGRSYNPRYGRFLQEDPFGLIDGYNRYTYSHHSPGNLTDYWGFSSNDIDWGTVASDFAKTFAIGSGNIDGGKGNVASDFAKTFAIGSGNRMGGQGNLKNQESAKTDLDYAVLLAHEFNPLFLDYGLDLLFGKKNNNVISGGIPGGKGPKENANSFIQGAYIAVNTVFTFLDEISEIGKVGVGAALKTAKQFGNDSKTFITYALKNESHVVYVGRASGVGTAEEVLAQRIAKGHHILHENPHLTPEVIAYQGNRAANRGAEDVWFQYYNEGKSFGKHPNSPLLNKTNPLSDLKWKIEHSRSKIESYAKDLSD
jgi:RHS repeat-associated protein